jgi:hypothetical protein
MLLQATAVHARMNWKDVLIFNSINNTFYRRNSSELHSGSFIISQYNQLIINWTNFETETLTLLSNGLFTNQDRSFQINIIYKNYSKYIKLEKYSPVVETKTQDITEDKTEDKIEDKTEDKIEDKSDVKSEDKIEDKTEDKIEDKSDVKSEDKIEDKSEDKSEDKIEDKSEDKIEIKKEDLTNDKMEVKTENKTEVETEEIIKTNITELIQNLTESLIYDTPSEMENDTVKPLSIGSQSHEPTQNSFSKSTVIENEPIVKDRFEYKPLDITTLDKEITDNIEPFNGDNMSYLSSSSKKKGKKS